MTLLILLTASVLYTLGGIAMKYSQAFQNAIPSLLVFVFFCLAAGIQTWAMKKVELGKGYLLVIGLEGIFAVLAGVVCFGESISISKTTGTLFILAGMLLLKL